MKTSVVHDQIPVLAATGTGGTSLSAFHDALVTLDLGHYNLVRLSSVIPPRTSVDGTGKAAAPAGAFGDRLYCVYAAQPAVDVGQEAWAGVGWIQRLDGNGGFFVEHEGTNEAYVENAIRTSLRDLTRGAEHEYTSGDWVLNGAVCMGRPVCSLVLTPYATQGWSSP